MTSNDSKSGPQRPAGAGPMGELAPGAFVTVSENKRICDRSLVDAIWEIVAVNAAHAVLKFAPGFVRSIRRSKRASCRCTNMISIAPTISPPRSRMPQAALRDAGALPRSLTACPRRVTVVQTPRARFAHSRASGNPVLSASIRLLGPRFRGDERREWTAPRQQRYKLAEFCP